MKKDFSDSIKKRTNNNPYIQNNIEETKEENVVERIVEETKIVFIPKNIRKGRPLGAKKYNEPSEKISIALPKSLLDKIKGKIYLSPQQLTLTQIVKESLEMYCKKWNI